MFNKTLELSVVHMDPVNAFAKQKLKEASEAGWCITAVFKPSIFRRKIVVYLQREVE